MEKENENEKEYFSKSEIKLLIATRLKYEKEFTAGKKSKSVLWGKVLAEMKIEVPEFRFDRTQIHRKFLNIMITYKRIKKRNKQTGRDATTWEHFDCLDEVYGLKHSIEPPVENLISTLLPAANMITTAEQESYSLVPSTQIQSQTSAENILFSEDVIYDLDETIHVTESNYTPPNKRRRTNKENETLEFLKQEAKREDLRHEEIMELERQKLGTERERIQEMRDLKTVLQQMLENRSAN